MSIDARLFRSVMGQFATGVTVITFLADGRPGGMTANAFMAVSLEPPLILISIRSMSRVNRFIECGTRFGVNILAENQLGVCAHFAGKAAQDIEFAVICRDGFPMLATGLAHLGVRAVDVHQAGDHLLYVSEVEYMRLGEQRRPLVFFGGNYRQVQTHMPAISWAGAADLS
jgi:flavin reductase (DIM6/NTAB) family NADH-FMN oxidoreductase RutF